MPAWNAPKEPAKRAELPPPPPKHHRPPHEATHEGLAHISEQIEELREMVEQLNTRIDQLKRSTG